MSLFVCVFMVTFCNLCGPFSHDPSLGFEKKKRSGGG